LHKQVSPSHDYGIDPRFGAEKRRVPTGPNPLHNWFCFYFYLFHKQPKITIFMHLQISWYPFSLLGQNLLILSSEFIFITFLGCTLL